MKLPDADVIFKASEMGKCEVHIPQNMEPSPIFPMMEEQIELLKKQLEIKETELKEAKQVAAEAKKNNRWMMCIAIVSMLAAIAVWLFPNILRG